MDEHTPERRNNMNDNSRFWIGVFLVAAGTVLFASKMGLDVPHWLLSWETFLIALGLLIGFKNKFRNPASFILILIGGASLLDDFVPDMNVGNYISPIIIIVLGLTFILRPKKYKSGWRRPDVNNADAFAQPAAGYEELIEITAIFGGVKKRILSKNFRGGDITAFMGGAELNLSQSDIQTFAVLDVSAVFGGVKLIVPPDWDVQNKATAIFGGLEDKRMMHAGVSNKVLIIDGVAVFGGVEIRSY